MTDEQDPNSSVLNAICTTRSIRRYTDDPVDSNDLRRILFAATRAPSGSNRQGFRFLLVSGTRAAQRARDLLTREYTLRWNEKAEREGLRQRSLQAPDSGVARMVRSMDAYTRDLGSAPVVILACCLEDSERPRLDGSSIFPACQNLLVAARALGYGGVLTQFHTEIEEELHGLLDIPANAWIAGVITLGRPQGRHGPLRRLPMTQTVFEGQWDRPASVVQTEPTRLKRGRSE